VLKVARTIAMFKLDCEYFAIEDVCTHDGGLIQVRDNSWD